MTTQVIILAAGQGKRMQSQLPKVLHTLAGKSLLARVIDTAHEVSPDAIPLVVYGHQGDALREQLKNVNVKWILQQQQLGTAHAVMQALPELQDSDQVLVLYGDVPLISPATLKKLVANTPAGAIGVLTAILSDPSGYGRIKRDANHHVSGIVEEKDASEQERQISEINTGIYYLPVALLKKWLPTLQNKNAQGEYYLTDLIAFASKEKIMIYVMQPACVEEILGVNDKVQLSHLERYYQRNCAEQLMRAGVTLYDPARFDMRGELRAGRDVVIDINVIIEGNVTIGNECVIGANVMLKNVVLGDRVTVKANSIIEGADIASDCQIGPFARIRPGTKLAAHGHVGNFVEIKNSVLGAGTKANHLSYIGDSEIGQRVNIGAGTITCNYDGANKHKTKIGDDVHIGSDTQLVAPVSIGNGATIGAGSTVVKDVPAHALTLTHKIEQRTVRDWVGSHFFNSATGK